MRLSIESIDGDGIGDMTSLFWTGSGFSLFGEGTREILTGSEDPSNQLARLFTPGRALGPDSCVSTSNSAAFFTAFRSGEVVLLVDLSEGRKVESLVGDVDCDRV